MTKHVNNIGAPCAKEVFTSDMYWCYCVESEIPCNTYCVNYYFLMCHNTRLIKYILRLGLLYMVSLLYCLFLHLFYLNMKTDTKTQVTFYNKGPEDLLRY